MVAEVIPLHRSPSANSAPHSPYKLDEKFEKLLVYRLCESPKLWVAVGRHIDPKALSCPPATLALEAAIAVATDTGRPPRAPSFVIQRMTTWRSEGKVTIDAVAAVRNYLADAIDHLEAVDLSAMDESLIAEMKPILQRRLRNEAVRVGIDNLSRHGDLADVEKLIADANAVGEIEGGEGATLVGVESLPSYARSIAREKSQTGIGDLDDVLRGGMPVGNMGTYLGSTGAGKTMSLVHTAVYNALSSKVVHAFTGEMSVADWEMRVLANLFAVPITAIRDSADTRVALQERIEEMESWFGTKFRIYCEWFTPKASSPRTIVESVDALEQRTGHRVDVVVVDYADKLRPDRAVNKDDKGYMAAGNVYEELRLFAEATKRWVWTATQATREKKRKQLQVEDMADSFEKARVADLVVTVNRDPIDRTAIKWGVAKFRHGEDGQTIGPLPSDYTCARVAPVPADLYPEPGVQELV